MDFYGFYTGKILNAYEYLGCHYEEKKTIFRTFAPKAARVSLIGEFSQWQEIPMRKAYDGNFWECFVEDVSVGESYKYRIYHKNGTFVDHADPYGFGMEKQPGTASVVRALNRFEWTDYKWLRHRNDCKNRPLNIYEFHFGSWRKPSENTWYSYKELAEPLISYVKEQGYNYIEIMPLAEHPCDNSWGYQQTGFYSPTSRYGTPEELRYFINYAHQNNIGIILDFVPVHFAVDAYGLAEYDGSCIYEYPHKDIGYNEWGSKNFNHSRGEVQSFLQSNARYWLKEFHFDGLRIDALSNIIYWQGNKERGENVCAIDFIKHMNHSLKKMDSSVMLIAEDSTAYPDVTKPVEKGGLGFDYKWDMGWMNDTLAFFKTHPYNRKRDYHKLTFSMMYFESENYLLPLSHDEVVHGKATIVQKMWGEYEDKFPQARALYLYMYTHPGKKLNFMGNEIGQLREWDEKREQDWDMLKYPVHDAFSRFIRELNQIYLNTPALWNMDYEIGGFCWIDCGQEEKCIYVFERRAEKQRVIVMMNLSDKKQSYCLKCPDFHSLRLVIASDDEIYGGNQAYMAGENLIAKEGRLDLELNPFTTKMYEILE